MGTRREYTQTTQMTRSQANALARYNRELNENGVLTPNVTKLKTALSSLMAVLTGLSFVPVASTAATVANIIVGLTGSFTDEEVTATSSALLAGEWCMDSICEDFDDNANWQMVEVSYQVRHYVDEGIKIVSGRNYDISKVMINGVWVS